MTKARNHVEYTQPTSEEAISAVRRAAESNADYIIIDNRRQRWLWEAAELAVSEGLLQEPTEHEGHQAFELRYRFTLKALKLAGRA